MRLFLITILFLLLNTLLSAQTYDWIDALNGNTVRGTMIALDADNNLFAVGEFNDTLDADPGPGYYPLIGGISNTFLIKYDPAGNLVWALSFNQPFQVIKMTAGADGSVYLAGNIEVSNDTLDADPGEGVFDLIVGHLNSPFIIKMDGDGQFQWAQNFEGTNNAYVFALTLNADGNIFLAGRFMSTVDFDFTAGVSELTADNIDSYILELDANGALVSLGSLTGPGSEYIADICFLPTGEMYICGRYSGDEAPDLDPGPGVLNAPVSSGQNLFVLKLNLTGEVDWLSIADASSTAAIYDMEVDEFGNVYTTGNFYYNVDFDPGPGEYILTYSYSYADLFVWCLDADGNFNYANKYGSWGNEFGNSISIGEEGKVYVTGNSQDNIDLDEGPGVELLPNTGLWDIFLFEISPVGDLLNYTTIGNSASNQGKQVIWDAGYIYMIGWYQDTLDVDPGSGVYEIPDGNSTQTFIAKYNPCVFFNGGEADFDDNGAIDVVDLDLLISGFGCLGNCLYDLDGDDITGASDVILFIYYMNGGCAP